MDKTCNGIGQPLHQGDDRAKKRRAEAGKLPQAIHRAAGTIPAAEPDDHCLIQYQWVMAHGFGASGKNQIGSTGGNAERRTVERLHTRRTVALDRPGRHFVAASNPQCHHPGDVCFFGARCRASEDDLVQIPPVERLAHQQGAAAMDGKIRCPEGTGSVPELQEGRSQAIDDEDWTPRNMGFRHHFSDSRPRCSQRKQGSFLVAVFLGLQLPGRFYVFRPKRIHTDYLPA